MLKSTFVLFFSLSLKYQITTKTLATMTASEKILAISKMKDIRARVMTRAHILYFSVRGEWGFNWSKSLKKAWEIEKEMLKPKKVHVTSPEDQKIINEGIIQSYRTYAYNGD